MSRSQAPLIAVILLLLPILYVVSYLAIVTPGFDITFGNRPPPRYRLGGQLSATLFWPLEQIDRKLRPEAWSRIDSDPFAWSLAP